MTADPVRPQEAGWLTGPKHVCIKPAADDDREGCYWRCWCGRIWEAEWDGWYRVSKRKARRILRLLETEGNANA